MWLIRARWRAAVIWLALGCGAACEREPAEPTRLPEPSAAAESSATTPKSPAPTPKRGFPEPQVCEVGATTACEGTFCDEHGVTEAECEECLRRAAAAGGAPSPDSTPPAPATPQARPAGAIR